MAIKLSDEEKRRIEHEEETRQAQDQYRAQVRKQLIEDPQPVRQSGGIGKGRLILGVLFVLFILYLVVKH